MPACARPVTCACAHSGGALPSLFGPDGTCKIVHINASAQDPLCALEQHNTCVGALGRLHQSFPRMQSRDGLLDRRQGMLPCMVRQDDVMLPTCQMSACTTNASSICA